MRTHVISHRFNNSRFLLSKYRWRAFDLVGRSAIALVLITSGLIHISGPFFFLESVLAYELIPTNATPYVVNFIMHLVLVLGLIVASGCYHNAIHGISAVVFAGFTIVQLVALILNKEISCGCFGPSEHAVGWQTIAVPLGLCFVSILLYRQPKFQ